MLRPFTRLCIVVLALVLSACGVSESSTGASTLPTVAATNVPPPITVEPPHIAVTAEPPATQVPQTPATATETSSGVVSATVGPPVTGGPTTTPLKSPETVTLTDDGQLVEMSVGESFLLNLGEDTNWDVQVADMNILSRKMGVMVIRGAQGIFEARAAGKTQLTATGTPNCAQGAVCPAIARLYQITVEVR